VSLNAQILRALAEGPLRLAELRREIGGPAQSTVRGNLTKLTEVGALQKQTRNNGSSVREYELTPCGQELLLAADAVELHTGAYCHAFPRTERELARLTAAARQAHRAGLAVHAGHGLNYDNVLAVARLPEVEELNITAFMNLMVILVPFLLMTAVFSRITILELNLPAGNAQEPQATQRFDLEITVRAAGIEVSDRQGGLLRRIPPTVSGQDLAQLSELLQQIKARFPDKLDATLLLEPQIDYDTVVQVMDKVRIARVIQAGALQPAELFPEIAIGDAPMDSVKVAENSRVKSP